MTISPAQQAQFAEEGFCVLDRVLSDEHLAILDAECQEHLDQQIALMNLVQADVLGLTHKNKRYFLSCENQAGTPMGGLLFSDFMASVVGSLLGPDAFLFLEIFVIKASHTGMALGWHQDSGYLMGQPHAPFVTLWCALDDATADNGALQVLPHSRLGSRDVFPHVKDKPTGDLIGYHGEDPGITVPVPRGSIIALSSTLFHRSGPNTTPAPRRAFLAAYSAAPILSAQGQLWNHAVPFLQNGERVGAQPGHA